MTQVWNPYGGDMPLVRIGDDTRFTLTDRLTGGRLSLSMGKVSQVSFTVADDMQHTLSRSRELVRGAHLHVAGFGFRVADVTHGTGSAGPETEVVALSSGVTRMRQVTGAAWWGKVDTTSWFRTVPRKTWAAWQYVIQPGLGRQTIIREKPEPGRDPETMWDVMTHAADNVGATLFEYGDRLVLGRPGWLVSSYWGGGRWVFRYDRWGTYSSSLAGQPTVTQDEDGGTLRLELVSSARRRIRPGDRVQMDGHLAHRLGMGGTWLVHDVEIPLDMTGNTAVECVRVSGYTGSRDTRQAEAVSPNGGATPVSVSVPVLPSPVKAGAARTAALNPLPTTTPPSSQPPSPPRPPALPAKPPASTPATTPPPPPPAVVPTAPTSSLPPAVTVKPIPPVTSSPGTSTSLTDPVVLLIGKYLANAWAIVVAAKRAGIPYPVACALIERETGGKNVYGHDAGGVFTVPWPGLVYVTEENYREFKRRIRAGEKSNGVGPSQITWPPYHYAAEDEGLKLWDPVDNIYFGLREFGKLWRSRNWNLAEAATLYNKGNLSGGVNEYGNAIVTRTDVWGARLAGRSEPVVTKDPATTSPAPPPSASIPGPAGWATKWAQVKSSSTGKVVMWPVGQVAGSGTEKGTEVTKPLWDKLWAWRAGVIGKRIDVDGRWGAQCVDPAKSWAMVFGFNPQNGIGNGKDVARTLANTYGWRFYGPEARARSGDVVSWAGAAYGYNEYGHTAVVVADLGSSLRVIQQNPMACSIGTMSKRGVVGYARHRSYDPTV